MADLDLSINGRLEVGETLAARVLGTPASLQWQALVNGAWVNVGTANSPTFVVPSSAVGSAYRLAATSEGQTYYSPATGTVTQDTKKANAPVLGGTEPGILSTEGPGERSVFSWLTLTDADRDTYAGGSLLVQNSNSLMHGGDGQDVLSIRFASGAGQFSYNAATRELRYTAGNGTTATVGTLDATLNGNGTDLKVTFNGNATAAIVDALVNNLQYRNEDDSPVATRLLTLRITDGSGASAQRVHAAHIEPQPDAPVFTSAAAFTVSENITAVGTVAALDPDVEAGQPQGITYSLVEGAADNARFQIDGASGALRFANPADYEAGDHGPQYSVRVRASDGNGGVAEQVVTVTVTDVNEAPVVLSAGVGAVTEAGASGAGLASASGQLLASDADGGDVIAWSGSALGLYGNLSLQADGQWTYALDNAAARVQSLAQGETVVDRFTATVTDAAGATAQVSVDITVTGANDAPVVAESSQVSGLVAEPAERSGTAAIGIDPGYGDPALVVTPGGRVIAAGLAPVEGGGTQAVLRSLVQGADADPAFGDQGQVVLSLQPLDLALDASGRLLVAGYTAENYMQSQLDWAIERRHPDGSLDTSFGSAGRLVLDLGGYDRPSCVAVDAQGHVYVAGLTAAGLSVLRLTPEGQVDGAFGQQGWLAVAPELVDTSSLQMQLDAQGRILVWGRAGETPGGESQLYVSRYLGDGQPDASFGDGGSALVGMNGFGAGEAALAVDAGGRILLGWNLFQGDWNFQPIGLAMLDANGQADASFGQDGETQLPLHARDLALGFDASGRPLIAFSSNNAADLQVARLTPSGALDDFNLGGTTSADVGGAETALGIRLLPDGTLMAIGNSYQGHALLGLAFFRQDGTPHTNWGEPVSHEDPTTGGALFVSYDGWDHGDTAQWSGNAAGLYGQFEITPQGTWTYTLDLSNPATQALQAGTTATEHFLATVTDSFGAQATQEITITVVGSDDPPAY